jgi:hypothetical protein
MMTIDIPPNNLPGSHETAIINNEYQRNCLQPKAHEHRLVQIEEEHKNRIDEMTKSSKLRIEEHREIERVRSHYGISTHKAIREIEKEEREHNEIEKNSPFRNPVDFHVDRLRKLFIENDRNPIVLFAPFKDDSKTNIQNIEGGYVNFLTTLNEEYAQTQYQHLTTKRDGYLNRPLLSGDCDVDSIYSVLADIPVILVHGVIQGTHHSHQLVQRIHPRITFWNLFPHQKTSIS